MLGAAHSIDIFENSRLSKSTSRLFEKFAYVSTIVGDINETHPLAFVSSAQGVKPTLLSHNQAMQAVDKDKFELSMAEEIEKMWANEIYEIIIKRC